MALSFQGHFASFQPAETADFDEPAFVRKPVRTCLIRLWQPCQQQGNLPGPENRASSESELN